jgi:hypothetical protein
VDELCPRRFGWLGPCGDIQLFYDYWRCNKGRKAMKQLKYWFLVLLVTACKFGYSQTDDNIRQAFTLKIFVDDSTFYNAPMGQTKYIPKDGVIQLFPGEKLFVEADIKNDTLVNLKVVPQITKKGKTLTLSFSQVAKGKIHEQMILKIDNPFAKSLNYSALINLLKYKKWIKTTVIPVRAGIASYENWSDIISTIVLSGFYLKN